MLDGFCIYVYKDPSGWQDVVYVLYGKQLVIMPQVGANLYFEI